MSEVRRCETQIKDKAILIEALTTLGIDSNSIEEGENLQVFDGQESFDVAIKVSRHAGKCSSDVGFVKNANGSYTAVVSGIDDRGLAQVVKNGRLKQCYAKGKILKTIKEQISRGEIVKDEEQGGRVRIRVKIPEY